MKQLTETQFFLLLKTNGNSTQTLKREYDTFATLLLTENNTYTGRMAHRNTLVYTHAELSGLTEVKEKKRGCFSY
jgi:hypothetical protein